MNVATLTVTNCLDCPNHVEFSDPGSDDSFDAQDTSIGCQLLSDESRKDRWNRGGFAVISASDRPYRHRSHCNVPNWCPLLKKAKRGKSQATKTKASA